MDLGNEVLGSGSLPLFGGRSQCMKRRETYHLCACTLQILLYNIYQEPMFPLLKSCKMHREEKPLQLWNSECSSLTIIFLSIKQLEEHITYLVGEVVVT